MDQDPHANDAFHRSQEEDNDSADDMTLPPSYEEAISQYANEETTTTSSETTITTTMRGHGRSQSQSQSSYSYYGGGASGPSRSSDYNLNDDIQGSDDDVDHPNKVPSARSTQTYIQPRSSGDNMHRRHGSSGHHGHGHHLHPAHFPSGSQAPSAPTLDPTITPSAPPLSSVSSSTSQPATPGTEASPSQMGAPPPNFPFLPFAGVRPPFFPTGSFVNGMSMPPMPPMPPMPRGPFGVGGPAGFGPLPTPPGFPHFAGFQGPPPPGPLPGFMARPPHPLQPPTLPTPRGGPKPKEFKFAKPDSLSGTSGEGSSSATTSGPSEHTIPRPPSPPPPPHGSGGPRTGTETERGPPVPLAGIPTAAGLVSAQDISTAEFSSSKTGVESKDAILDDPFQLYRFFVAHNDRPSMHVLVTGCHMEKRKVEDRNHDGTTSTVTSKVRVQDFKMSFDLTPLISPSGTITTLPNPKTGRSPTLREVMEQHVEEDNPFKELLVNWDFEHLTRAITHAIRSVNYRYTIEISYPVTHNRVVRNFYKKVDDASLRSEFQMTVSTNEFYMNNYWNIIEQVQFKTK
ncbi:hypothetical protein BGZ74_010100 [Mortierella antarctica]|nr:hypothetical protein BGZ74_010100 [Mortierella antarctica]